MDLKRKDIYPSLTPKRKDPRGPSQPTRVHSPTVGSEGSPSVVEDEGRWWLGDPSRDGPPKGVGGTREGGVPVLLTRGQRDSVNLIEVKIYK